MCAHRLNQNWNAMLTSLGWGRIREPLCVEPKITDQLVALEREAV